MFEKLAYDLTGLTVPVLGLFAFSLPLLSKVLGEKRFPAVYALIAMAFSAVSSTIIFLRVYETQQPIVYGFGGWPPPIGISYEVDGFSALLGMFTAWMMFVIGLYSIWYNRHFDEPEWYYILLIGLLAGMLGCIYTGDVFNLFVMLEVLGISAYALVAYNKSKAEALEAAMKYAIIGATATTIYFIGLVLIYGVYGTLNMAHLALVAQADMFSDEAVKAGVGVVTLIAVSLSLWVFTYKSALFPNHFWLPDAHPEAPTPVSAALSGLVVNVGVYATARFLYTIFCSDSVLGLYYRDIVMLVLLILGFLGGVIGALMMLVQKDLKRLLAYSTVSHIGLTYMALAATLATNSVTAVSLAISAVILHIITHGIGKSLLFMASGVFIDAAGTRDMDEMQGVGRKYQLVSMAFIAGFLSLTGLIPFAGFFSKLLIYEAFLAGRLIVPAVMVIVVSAISFLGYMKAIYSVVFAVPRRDYGDFKEGWVKYLLIVLAGTLLVLGSLFPWIRNGLYSIAFNSMTPIGKYNYINAFYYEFEKLFGGVLG